MRGFHPNYLYHHLDPPLPLDPPPDWAVGYGPVFLRHIASCHAEHPETLVQLQELSFAFQPRLETFALVVESLERAIPVEDFCLVVGLIHTAVATEEPWEIPETMSTASRDVFIRVIETYIPFGEEAREQLRELEPKYLLRVLRDPYMKGPEHRYPERYAEAVSRDVDKFHGYQRLMAEDNKYAAQAQIEENYIQMAEEEIQLFVEARDSFQKLVKGMGNHTY